MASGAITYERHVAVLECADVQALDTTISSTLEKELGDEPFYPDYLLRMLVASGIRTTEDARRGAAEHAPAIATMVAPYYALTEQIWQLSPRQMPRLPRGYSLFFLAHVVLLLASALRLEKIDYPEDAKMAHHVASLLADAFGHIDLA